MAGLIQENMSGDELTPEKVNSQIKMPPELQEAYDRVVLAGMKVMFSKATHDKVLKAIQGEGPLAKRLGVGIAGLMAELFKQSNQTIPPQVLIPAGTNLLVQAADFLKRTGAEQVDNQTLGEAMQVMVNTILDMFGIDPMKLRGALDQFDQSRTQQASQQMGAAPEQGA